MVYTLCFSFKELARIRLVIIIVFECRSYHSTLIVIYQAATL